MYLVDEQYDKAQAALFDAFKAYDDAGDSKRISCLKYVLLANMLAMSNINPFDAPECSAYKNDKELLAMTALINAYQNKNNIVFEKILRDNEKSILQDPFMRKYIDDLLKNIRTEKMIDIIRPYTRISIPFIAQQLNISLADVESLLVTCILDGVIKGGINQVEQLLVIEKAAVSNCYKSLQDWSQSIDNSYRSIVGRVN